MFKILSLILLVALFATTGDFYSFKVKNIDGDDFSLESYKGKAVLIVNTASKCGYTKQYDGLQKLYDTYKDQGLVVLGAPANNFGGQEPGTEEEIKEFCSLTYSVEFPMLSKVSVKGEKQDPLFTWLTSEKNPDFTGDIKWNFEKFLISKDGKLLHRFRSGTTPQSEEMIAAVEKALK